MSATTDAAAQRELSKARISHILVSGNEGCLQSAFPSLCVCVCVHVCVCVFVFVCPFMRACVAV